MYVAKRYLTKYIYVCLGSKIPWICMYIAKIPHKNIHMLSSKIPHEKKKQKQTRKKIKKNKKKGRKKKREKKEK